MAKEKPNEFVLHDWVSGLPFQMQALLFTGFRGPDTCEKHNSAKVIVRYLRGAVAKPAANWNGKNNNDFMWGEYEYFDGYASTFYNDHDGYPHHFIMHLIHCAQVIGYYYPDTSARMRWHKFYLSMCDSMHMHAETREEMEARLNDFGCGIHNKEE